MIEKSALIGIQGGLGSYNDTAIRLYLKKDYNQERIIFLDSTPNVFKALNDGEIRYGQFAVYNNRSGLYMESLNYIAQNVFTVVENYRIPVNHALMIHTDQTLDKITRIVTHKEVVKQCKKSIQERYRHLELEYTIGKLIDPSDIAFKIATESLDNVAVIGNPTLAEIYHLQVADRNLSDDPDSQSTFLLIEKR